MSWRERVRDLERQAEEALERPLLTGYLYGTAVGFLVGVFMALVVYR